MKLKPVALILSLAVYSNTYAADLLSVYHDAATNSPILSTDLNTALATSQTLPINISNYLPQVVGTASAGVNNVHGGGSSTNYSASGYGLTITQQLFNYTDLANVTQAQYTKESAMTTYKGQQQQFILNVAEAYFDVLNAEYDVELAQSQYNFLQKTLDQTQAKYSVGLANYTDVAQARANFNSAYATLIAAQNNLAISNENLRTYTGKEETNLATVADLNDLPINPPNPDNVDYWVRVAESQNPSLLAQQQTEEAAFAAVHASVGNQLPTVYVQASYQKNYYSDDTPNFISPNSETLNKSIELGLTWNIFSGGELMSQTLQAANQYVSQENTSTNLYRETASQTIQDYLSILSSIAQIRAYQQSQIAAEASLREFDAKYKVGTATIVDVLNAVQTLYQARYNLAQAVNQYIDNVLSLKADVGTLSEKDLAEFNQYLKIPADNTESVST